MTRLRLALLVAILVAAVASVFVLRGERGEPAPRADRCRFELAAGETSCTVRIVGDAAPSSLRCGELRELCAKQVRCVCPAAPPEDRPRTIPSHGPDSGTLRAPQALEVPPPEVEGNRATDVAEVERAVAALRPLVLQCLGDVPRLEGEVRLTIGFTVLSGERAGRLSGATVDASVGDPYLTACLEDSVEDARFPSSRPPAPISARQTFIFR